MLQQETQWSERPEKAPLRTACLKARVEDRQEQDRQRAGTDSSLSLLIKEQGWPQLELTGLDFNTCQEGAS